MIEKQKLRYFYKQRRLLLEIEEKESASMTLAKLHAGWLSQYSRNKIIAAYMPHKNEIDPSVLIKNLPNDYSLAMPKIIAQDMLFILVNERTIYDVDHFGISYPHKGEAVIPDIILVPFIVADLAGHRLGYGKGFYDKYINNYARKYNILAIGIGYDWQIVPSLPAGPHDKALNYILTDRTKYIASEL